MLLETLREASAEFGLAWDQVGAADAKAPSSRERRGLEELVRRSWPRVDAAIDAAVNDTEAAPAPVLLTEASPLARYDNVGLLARWTDLAAPRERAVWLLIPQFAANQGPLLDGRPVPLAAPNQFVALDTDWVDGALITLAAASRKDA